MSKISFVYFDVGGVVIKDFSDSGHWSNMKRMLNLDPSQDEAFETLYKVCEEKMCKGEDDKQYLPLFTKQFGITFPPGFTFTKYIVNHFAINPGIYPSIRYAKSKCRVGLLTDMYLGMRNYMQKRGLFPDIEWDTILDSSELGVKKPMPEIYQIATKRADVPASEILFIDNRDKNLVPVRELGWQTFLYDSSNYDQANVDLAKFLGL